MKYKCLTVIFLCLLVIVAGCNNNTEEIENSAENENGNTDTELQVAYSQQPPTIDTHASQAQAAADIAMQVFETLVAVDSNYDIQPMLADSWEVSDDNNSIVFHLRENVLFHNGTELTADDVVASMNRWIDITGPGQEQFEDASFEKIDDYTVELTMETPTSTALAVLAYGGGNFAAIMPEEVIETADVSGVDDFIGTGPFEFVEWQQDQHIYLTRFEEYAARSEESDGASGNKEAQVDDLYFQFVTDASTRVSGIQSGEYDISQGLSADTVGQLESNPEINLNVSPGGFLSFFFNKEQGLFTDVNARQAVAKALNYDDILETSFNNEEYYDLTHQMMLTSQQGQWDSEVGAENYNVNDLEAAQDQLAETDYNGEEITIMTTRENESTYQAAVVLEQQLDSLGINTAIEVFDRATFESRRDDPELWDMFVLLNTPKPEPSSNVFLRPDFAGWTQSEDLDEILDNFRSQPSLEETQPYYDELQSWFWDYIPIIKLGDYMEINATQEYIDGFDRLDSLMLWNVTKED